MPSASARLRTTVTRGLDRLLHHVAELAGVGELALAGTSAASMRQQFAADLGPGQAGDLADPVLLLGTAEAEARRRVVSPAFPASP
jgi:hypothetical protein